ncbi:MAG: DUF4143 domain-containing protein, partial [Gemmatimonadota bacterium]|nr:DUF4143 domain-containing protein [Gemmatimonadota bacterium]
SSPKLNVLNTALMTMPLTGSFDETRADRTLWGRIVESAVGAHLHNTAGRKARLYHWREGPHEVDFVLSRGPNLKGIEVKSGAGAGRRRGRVAFRERFPGARTLLVGARGVPLEDFLSQSAVYWADYDGPFARDDTRTETAEKEDDEMSNEGNGRETVRESTPKYAGTGSSWRRRCGDSRTSSAAGTFLRSPRSCSWTRNLGGTATAIRCSPAWPRPSTEAATP